MKHDDYEIKFKERERERERESERERERERERDFLTLKIKLERPVLFAYNMKHDDNTITINGGLLNLTSSLDILWQLTEEPALIYSSSQTGKCFNGYPGTAK
jgi:hypothetical protein